MLQSCPSIMRELHMRYMGILAVQRRYCHASDTSSAAADADSQSSSHTCSSYTEEQRYDVVVETAPSTEGDGPLFGTVTVKPKVDMQPPETAKILRYLRRSVKLTDQDIHSYSYTTPSVLGSSLVDIQARVEKLQRVSFKSSNKERLGMVLARFPRVVEADLVNVHSVCQLLEKYKFNRNWIRSLLKHHANLFTHDPSKVKKFL